MVKVSMKLLRFSAETTPSRTPNIEAKIIAKMVNSMVIGRRSAMMIVIGRRSLIELPKSPFMN